MNLIVTYTDVQIHDALIDLQDRDVIAVPVFTSLETHPAITAPCFIAIAVLQPVIDDVYIFPIQHDEIPVSAAPEFSTWNTSGIIYTLFKKQLLHALPSIGKKAIDIAGMGYLNTGKAIPDIELPVGMTARTTDSLEYTPLMVLVEYAESMLMAAHRIYYQHHAVMQTKAFEFHNFKTLPTLWAIERAGMYIDPTLFRSHFSSHIAERVIVDDTWVYTEYNPYSTTGRIAGRFNGFVSSAISKKDGSRSAFTSRFGQDGSLVLIDFESFHLRLIANAIGYTLPAGSVHEYLAKHYFGVDTITPEQYAQGKEITFQLLYDDTQTVDDIPFFVEIRKFVQAKWYEFLRDKAVITTSGRIIWEQSIDDPTPKKLFNYFFQLREMEVSIQGIYRLISRLATYKSKPMLYTYDSILVDCHKSEKDAILRISDATLTENGAFPVKFWEGPNFQDMTPIKI